MADIEVTIGAQIDELIAAVNLSADSVAAALARMETSITTVASSMESQLVPAVESANEHLASTREETQTLGEALEGIQGKFTQAFQATGLAFAYEGIQKVREEVEKLGERATQILSFSQVLGVSVQQIQAMQIAAEEGGTSFEVFARAIERLGSTLTSARDGSGQAIEKLKDLGLTTQQIQDPLFGTNDALAVLKERLENSGTAQQTMNELIKEFGPRAALAANAIKEYDGSTDGVAKTLQGVNALDEEQIKQLHELEDWWKRLGTTIANTTSKLILWISNASHMPTAGAAESMSAEQQAQLGGGSDNGEQAAQAQQGADSIIEAYAHASSSRVELEEIVTKETLAAIQDQVAATKAGTEQRVESARQFYEASKEYYGGDNVKEVQKAHQEMVAADRAYAEEYKKNLEELSAFADQMYTQTTNAAVKSAQEIEKESAQAFKEGVALAQQSAKGQLDAVTAGIAQQEAAIKGSQKSGSISSQQELQQEISLIQQKLQAQLSYYETLKYLAQGNALEQEKLTQEEVKANQQAGTAIIQAQNQFSQQFKQQWQSVFNTVENAFSSNVSKMIEGSETWQKAMKNITTSILDAVINMFVKWVAQQAVSMAETLILGKTAAVGQISANAATAATGAMASVAAIPYIGWAMAPEVGASTFALAEGYQASIASAAGGYDIPSDQLIYAHKNEMVLPAHLSEGIKDMISTNQQAVSGGGGGGVNLGVTTMDSQSFHSFLKNSRNRDAMAKEIRRAHDRGSRHLK